MQGGACGEHPEGAVRTARVVTHSMKCVRSYYIHVGVSCVMDFFYEDDECAVWCARLEEGLRSKSFAALEDDRSSGWRII